MEPAWHGGLRIGVPILAFCVAMMLDQWLDATVPPRRRLWSWASWTGAAVVGLAPLVMLGNLGLIRAQVSALVLGTLAWGYSELRHRWYQWRIEVARRNQQAAQFRKFTAKDFDR